jgi:hypothetical protein
VAGYCEHRNETFVSITGRHSANGVSYHLVQNFAADWCSGEALDLYSVSATFQFRSGYKLSSGSPTVFLSLFLRLLGHYLEIGIERLLPNPNLLTIHVHLPISFDASQSLSP